MNDEQSSEFLRLDTLATILFYVDGICYRQQPHLKLIDIFIK